TAGTAYGMIGHVSVVDRVDGFQRRHPVLGFPIAVAWKFFDDSGGYLAALLTYYGFISLFPLLILISTILSVVLVNDPGLQQEIIESALRQVPVIGDQLGDPRSLSGGPAGVVIGSAVSIYGALGVGNALQYAMNTIWSVPRNSRPNPILTRGRSLLIVPLGLLVVTASTTIATIAASYDFGSATKWLVMLATILLNAGVMYLTYRIGVGVAERRHLIVGSVVAAVLLQVLQTFGVVYVGRVVRDASASNGVVGFVLGLLAFIYLAAVILIVCAEINAVSAKRLYPRALLTPFTDNVSLTDADKRQYAAQARMMRTKQYERIDATFEPPPERSARPPKSVGEPAKTGGEAQGEPEGDPQAEASR
ncbi:MAG TPA: YihY/virulence factor BrkB family protein, partial [Tetrasphaera sp.]